MTAWDELQQWLMMNVGSKEADECTALINRVVAEVPHESNAAAIVHDCRQLLNEYLEPNRPSGDANEMISKLLDIIDGPRGHRVKKEN